MLRHCVSQFAYFVVSFLAFMSIDCSRILPANRNQRALISSVVLGASAVDHEREQEECVSLRPCEQCTASERKDNEACQPTGKLEAFKCTQFDEQGVNSISSRIIFQSCKRTKADEEFIMVQVQVFCLLVGSFAFLSVRQQQISSASLFDLRKRNRGYASTSIGLVDMGLEMVAAVKRKTSSSTVFQSSEHTRNDRNDEIEQLLERDTLEVV